MLERERTEGLAASGMEGEREREKETDLLLFLTDQLTEIHEQWFFLRDERTPNSAPFSKLFTGRRNAVSALNGYCGQRDELNQKIQAKIAAERQECFFEVPAQGEQRATGKPDCLLPAGVFSPGFQSLFWCCAGASSCRAKHW